MDSDRSTSTLSVLAGDVSVTDQTFFNTFKDAVSSSPTRAATIYGDVTGNQRSMDYGEMDRLSNRMANFLRAKLDESKSGRDIIAVSLRPSEELPAILLAIMKSGMAYLPLDLEYPRERVDYILKDSQPAICILDTSANIDWYNGVRTVTDRQLITQAQEEEDQFEIDDTREVAVVLYTSGSTGLPKGVQLTYPALMNRLMWQWKTLPYDSNETFCISKTALTFVDSICEIWSPLLQGRTLVLVPKATTRNPEKLAEFLNEFKIQRLTLVPSLLKSLLIHLQIQGDRDTLIPLRLWICSGETLPTNLAVMFFNWFKGQKKILANFYGSTEVMGDVSYYFVEEYDHMLGGSSIPIGQPVDNCMIYLVDESLNLVEAGEIGEMLVAGQNLSRGYISGDSASRFMDNPFQQHQGFTKVYRTGDYARLKNQQLFYEGRRDNQIKVRGHRIDLSEIERVVLNMVLVDDVAVLPKKDENSGEGILCFVVPKSNDLNVEMIERDLRTQLPEHMIPKVIIVDRFPLLNNGKIDRISLMKYHTDRSKRDSSEPVYDYTGIPAAQLGRAKVLFSTIASITGLGSGDIINQESNFYNLGGNSLNSIETVLRLREDGNYIGITDFITAKNMKDILERMRCGGSSTVDKDKNDEEGIELEMLDQSHRDAAIRMITDSFLKKADLERWLIPEIKEADYRDLMQELWDPLVEKNYSFILKNIATGQILSVALNFDAYDEPALQIGSKLAIIFDFLEYLEGPIRESHLPKGRNKIFHTFMMATNEQLSMAENVLMMKIMEQKCIEIAKGRKFLGILTTNTSPLTQQLGENIFKYETLLEYQVNRYETPDGMRPFSQAPDEQKAVVSWKSIEY